MELAATDTKLYTKDDDQKTYSLDEAIEHIGFGRYQVKVILIAGLSWMADAMEMMILSILAPTLLCEWGLETYQEALITTIVFLGQGFGSMAWGYACDVYGRKKGLYLSVCVVLFFGLLSSQAPNYEWMMFLRFLVGFGIGGVPQAVTIVTEVLPSSSRGRSIVLLAFFWALGSLLAASLAIVTMESLGWSWYLIIITLPMLLFLFTGLWLPESPRYLITTGQHDQVETLLRKIAKDNRSSMPEGTLTKQTANKKEDRGRVGDLFRSGWRKTIFLLFIIWFTSAFTYYGIVLLTTEMFQSGIDGCNPYGEVVNKTVMGEVECQLLDAQDYIDFMITTLAEFPGLILAMLTIEWLGRKKSLAVLFTLAAVFFLLLAICTGSVVSLIFVFGVRSFVTGSFQAIYVYTPEILPTNVRAIGLGACNAFARLGAMSTPFVAQVLIDESFYSVLGVYAALIAICVVSALLLPIETKGKMLADSTKNGSVTGTSRDEYESLN